MNELTLTFDTDMVVQREWLARELFEGKAMDVFLYEVDERAYAMMAAAAPDLTTPAGRKEMASIAYIPRRLRAAIAAAKKDYTAEIRAQLNGVNATTKIADDRLEALAVALRAPLDAIEAEEARVAAEAAAAEEARIAAIASAMRALDGAAIIDDRWTAVQIERQLATAREIEITEAIFQERLADAQARHAQVIGSLERDLELAQHREAMQKRLAEDAERRRRDEATRKAAQEVAAHLERTRTRIDALSEHIPLSDAPASEWQRWLDIVEALRPDEYAPLEALAGERLAAVRARLKVGLAYAAEVERLRATTMVERVESGSLVEAESALIQEPESFPVMAADDPTSSATVIASLRRCANRAAANDILCDLLTALGYPDVVAMYREMTR